MLICNGTTRCGQENVVRHRQGRAVTFSFHALRGMPITRRSAAKWDAERPKRRIPRGAWNEDVSNWERNSPAPSRCLTALSITFCVIRPFAKVIEECKLQFADGLGGCWTGKMKFALHSFRTYARDLLRFSLRNLRQICLYLSSQFVLERLISGSLQFPNILVV